MKLHPASATHGFARSLPSKLEKLVSPDANHVLQVQLSEREKEKILHLKGQLQEIVEFLMDPSEVEFPASVAVCWVEEVRELSYDIDDFHDELVNKCQAIQKDSHGSKLMKRRRRWISSETSRFKLRLEKAIQQYKTYNLQESKKRQQSYITSDDDERAPPPPPLCGLEDARPVGIGDSLAKVENWLTDEGEPKRRVVAVVGLGGVGKTTLANEVYRDLRKQFDCHAFVRSSQMPDMRELLTSILLQVRPHRPPDASESCNLTNTIRTHLQQRTHLKQKKYFIVIDDLWALSTWDLILQALPDDNCFSRILTTTEVDAVAHRCCGYNSNYMLRMEPFSKDRPQELLFSRFDGKQHEFSEPSHEISPESTDFIKEIKSEILRKCGGFPLAIVLVSSLLARESRGKIEKWNYIWSSLSSNLRTNPTVEGMKQVLSLCYNSLPDHLKTCMLYLSIYKQGHIIWKDDLVKLWIAEGFICAKEGKDMEEVASTYFDELVTKGMIQPVQNSHNGQVISCTVHYMILELIQCKSIEVNFVVTVHHSETNIRLGGKVRRLSLHYVDAEDAKPPDKLELSQVRTLAFYGLYRCMPSLAEFQLLRVIILDLWSDHDYIKFELPTFCKLGYLEIACNVKLVLQIQLQGLRYLETLKIDSRSSEVPQDIVHLPCLLHLSLPSDTNLPNCIGHMSSLRTFGCFNLSSNSADNVKSLDKLMNLRDLRLTCSTMLCDILEEKFGILSCVLPELSNLKSLTLLPAENSSCANIFEASSSDKNIPCDRLLTVSPPPALLEKLELSPRICIFSRLPRWIGDLRNLSILKIATRELSQSEMDALNSLAALSALLLFVSIGPSKRIVLKEGFRVLKHFKFICPTLCLAFEKGTMPDLRSLKLGFNTSRLHQYSVTEAGFENLKRLSVFSAKIRCAGAPEHGRQAKSTLEDALRSGERKRIINIYLVDGVFDGDQEMNMVGKTDEAPTLDKAEMASGDKDSSTTVQISQDGISTQSLDRSSSTGNQGVTKWRLKNTYGPGDTALGTKYVISQYMKQARFRAKDDIAEIKRQMELFTATVAENKDNSPGSLPEKRVILLQDLVHDIEDFIDVYNWLHIRSWRRTLAHMSQIVRLKNRINMIPEFQQNTILSKNEAGAAPSGPSAVSSPNYATQGAFVGMDSLKDELLRLVHGDTYDDRSSKPMVISIVGPRGVGKTTLARSFFFFLETVYDVWSPRFDRNAWVGASESCSTEDLLCKICQQVYKETGRTSHDIDTYAVQKILRKKRCLIVIDDLQQAGLWHDIQNALGDAEPGSRIIVTTSIQSVAAICSPESHIIRMQGLDHSGSEELFMRTLGRQLNPTPAQKHALQSILPQCGGLPVAVISLANYLRGQGQRNLTERMAKISNDLAGTPGALEVTGRMFTKEYNCLPGSVHRTCLLSLSTFPTGHLINRKRLIRRWIAEGFVVRDGVLSAQQVADDCFDKLIDRNIIEPVSISINSKVKSCRVNGFLLACIINRSVGRHFITLIRGDEPSRSAGACPVRRLSVHGGTTDSKRVAMEMGLNRVRSLTIYRGVPLDFRACRLLRVLDMEGCNQIDDSFLTLICSLVLLKYLSLRDSNVSRIPSAIRNLSGLETLDMRKTRRVDRNDSKTTVVSLPIDVFMLPRLSHLFGLFQLPQQLKNKRKRRTVQKFFSEESRLHTLSGFVTAKDDDFESILLHMRRLRKLKIWVSRHTRQSVSWLQELLMSNNVLESLSIDLSDSDKNETLQYSFCSMENSNPCMLSSIKLRGRLGTQRLPKFVTSPANSLTELQLSSTGLPLEELSTLQKLRRLLYLKLAEDGDGFPGHTFVVERDGFPSLERLCFEAPKLPPVHIVEGAMPALTSLHLLCPMSEHKHHMLGIEYLENLNDLVLHSSTGDEELDLWMYKARNRTKVTRQPRPYVEYA